MVGVEANTVGMTPSDQRGQVEYPELVSKNARRMAREYLTSWTLREIGDLFEDNGFQANLAFSPATSGERRTYVEQFYYAVDWSSREQVERMLLVFEAILDEAERRESHDLDAMQRVWSKGFITLLGRDGIIRDGTGRLKPRWSTQTLEALHQLPAESSIPVLMKRMWGNLDDDPEATIGAAKDVIEATAKHVILSAGESISASEKFPALLNRAMEHLGVDVKTVDSSRPGADSIRRILGSLSAIATGVNELRNHYGAGHGRPTMQSGLRSRHATLAAQAAETWVNFVLATEQDRRERDPVPKQV